MEIEEADESINEYEFSRCFWRIFGHCAFLLRLNSTSFSINQSLQAIKSLSTPLILMSIFEAAQIRTIAILVVQAMDSSETKAFWRHYEILFRLWWWTINDSFYSRDDFFVVASFPWATNKLHTNFRIQM